jgi:hypothetical protein
MIGLLWQCGNQTLHNKLSSPMVVMNVSSYDSVDVTGATTRLLCENSKI